MFDNLDINALITGYVVPWSINIAMAIVIFVVGRIAAKLVTSFVRKLMRRAEMDEILVNFIGSIVGALLMLFVIVAAIDQLGVNTTSLIAIVGAAGLAVGLALQGSLQNFAAGVMLIVFRPFKTGDYVEAGGTAGTVEHISIFSTTLETPDNKEVIVPNGAIYGDIITNYSARDTRRVDMAFGVGYDDDLVAAREIIRGILDADERVLKEPAAQIAVSELGDSSVNLVVRPWVNSADYWAVKFETTEKVKLAFDSEGVSIPYPQMDVHMSNAA